MWYKDAVFYEVHVRAFCDSDGDGIGDFVGLTQKLDYLQDLGVTTIWLLPFYPSPLKDDGYDIADYTDIHPAYGTLPQFKLFLREAHRRALRVITELVINHTSDQHPWFQKARHAPSASSIRDFYVWSDSPQRYSDARIIFQDFEHSNWTWDPLAKAYYWHRFYSHQPDLNFDNPQVHQAIFQVLKFWMDLGVDGFRLDAIPYLYEREGTSCENLPQTHSFLKKLRHHVQTHFPNRMLLAEANQWPEDSSAYFGKGDECQMAFHFPLMPRLFMAVRMESRFPVEEILQQTPAIPESCQWALFLRNHDELTLEMVTDEERDYMYRAYAQDSRMRINLGIRRRLAPLLRHNRRLIELLNSLLCSLPGSPVIYYGDEIGMGDNIYLGDRNGVRTPMQWSADRNAGFSEANAQKLYLPVIIDAEYHYEAVNVQAQQRNPSSLLWWMKRLLDLRQRFQAFGRGSLEFLHPDNSHVLAFLRRTEKETLLIVANLSRYVQYVELDLSTEGGKQPIELFGQTNFPLIGSVPYPLTLGPHGFYWFSLTGIPQTAEETAALPGTSLPSVEVAGRWEAIFQDQAKEKLESILPAYLKSRRWFSGKARRIRHTQLLDALAIVRKPTAIMLAFIEVAYTDGDPETYVLPLTYGTSEDRGLSESQQSGVLARIRMAQDSRDGFLYEATPVPAFSQALLEAVAGREKFFGTNGFCIGAPSPFLKKLLPSLTRLLEPRILAAEQTNTGIVYGKAIILKLLRRVECGIHPELEIGRFLTEEGFTQAPIWAGHLEYRREGSEPMVFGLLHGFVPNEADLWSYTLHSLGSFFEQALESGQPVLGLSKGFGSFIDMAQSALPTIAQQMAAASLDMARLLGRRTAELHHVLAQRSDDPAFKPEPFSVLYQRSLYQAMATATHQVMRLLRKQLPSLPEGVRPEAEKLLSREGRILERFRLILSRKMTAMRIRCHGDYHLGQVLYTGKDVVIFDFEGEPARSLTDRRIKRSPLRDVAGMLRSFHYATQAVLRETSSSSGMIRAEDRAILDGWALGWQTWVSAAFLNAYLTSARQALFLPRSMEEFKVLLSTFLLEKAVYELGYELNHRPDWVAIPIRGLFQLLEVD